MSEYRKGAKITRIEDALLDPTEALEVVGMTMQSSTQERFETQKDPRGDRWKPRAPTNVYGVIRDLQEGYPKDRRFERTPVLIDTGELSKSIVPRVSGKAVYLGSALHYASTHQLGGAIQSDEITDDVQKRLAEWLAGPGQQHESRLSWLLSPSLTGGRLEGEVEARPFLGVSKQDVEDIVEIIGVHIVGIDE